MSDEPGTLDGPGTSIDSDGRPTVVVSCVFWKTIWHCECFNKFWLFKYLMKHAQVVGILWNNLLERLQFTTFKTRKYISCNSILFLKVIKNR